MKVYVVMSNDFPDSVFKNEADAEAYCDSKNKAPDNQREYGGRRIYWRVYGFALDEKSNNAT